MADENYLYSFPKSKIEEELNTLESKRNDASLKYLATYMNESSDGSQITELIDPRTRLAVIENKEAINSLNERLSNLNISSNDTPNYIEAGKAFVRMPSESVYCYGRRAQGNGYNVFLSGQLNYSKDGEDFKTVNCDYYMQEGIETVGFEASYGLFRYAQIVFADNAFFLYCPKQPIIIYTTDFTSFTKVNLDAPANGLLMVDGEIVKFIDTSSNNVYKITKDGGELLGTANISLNFNNLDQDEIFIKFNEYYYAISYYPQKLYKSADLINYTEVSTSLWGDVDRYALLKDESNNDILVISNKTGAAFTTDGETWTDIALPTFVSMDDEDAEDEESEDENDEEIGIRCPDAINIHKLNGKYYAILRPDTGNHYGGIYQWSSLNKTPKCIYLDKENELNNTNPRFNQHSVIKSVDDNLFFIYRGNIFEINDLGVFRVSDSIIPNTSFPDFDYNAFAGEGDSNRSSQTNVFKINGNLYFADSGSTEGYKQVTVYKPE